MPKLEDIKFDESPNFTVRGTNPVTYIVIHACDGTYQGTIATFKNRNSRVSAHYLLDRDGTALQMVKLEYAAWHVLGANRFSIGIEHVDRYLISGSLTGGSDVDPNWMGQKQLQASAEIVAQLMLKYNVPLNHVIGHNDQYLKQFGNTHRDPGKYWPWVKYRSMIQAELAKITPAPVEVPPSVVHVETEPAQTPPFRPTSTMPKINFNKGKKK